MAAPKPKQSTDVRAERVRLHDALIDLCYERGFRGLSVEDLCRRAGVERSVFEREYADLEDCFCQVYFEIRKDFFARLAESIVVLHAWRDRLRAAAYFLLEFFAEDPRVTYFGMVEVRRAGERAQLLFGEVFESIFDLLDEGREELPAPQAISRTTAESISGGIFGQIYSAIGEGQLLRADAVPEMLYAAVLPYLGPDAAAEELTLAG